MKIACLGWGSLIWMPRSLPIRRGWFSDGPLLPIEFARESGDRRITLVLANVNHRVRTLWALMSVDTLDRAKSALATREGITESNIRYSIGYWDSETDTSHGEFAAEIGGWAKQLALDAVVWTNLKVGFKDKRGELPQYDQILEHLRWCLSHEERAFAEEYVRKAPTQIDTEYRRNLERDLGWTPIEV
jgi:hypothetical protein